MIYFILWKTGLSSFFSSKIIQIFKKSWTNTKTLFKYYNFPSRVVDSITVYTAQYCTFHVESHLRNKSVVLLLLLCCCSLRSVVVFVAITWPQDGLSLSSVHGGHSTNSMCARARSWDFRGCHESTIIYNIHSSVFPYYFLLIWTWNGPFVIENWP